MVFLHSLSKKIHHMFTLAAGRRITPYLGDCDFILVVVPVVQLVEFFSPPQARNYTLWDVLSSVTCVGWPLDPQDLPSLRNL